MSVAVLPAGASPVVNGASRPAAMCALPVRAAPLSVEAVPAAGCMPLYRFSVEQYHRMIAGGVITEADRVELLEGYLVPMNGHNPPHDGPIVILQRRLSRLLPDEWIIRTQMPVTLDTSEPEPDLAAVRGPERQWFERHPGPADIGLLIESSDSSLAKDRGVKAPAYARNRIPNLWIINIAERQVEVYADPTGPATLPEYRQRKDYGVAELVPVVLDGREYGTIPVRDLLP